MAKKNPVTQGSPSATKNPGGVQAYPAPTPGAYGKEAHISYAGPSKTPKSPKSPGIVTKLPGAKTKIPK